MSFSCFIIFRLVVIFDVSRLSVDICEVICCRLGCKKISCVSCARSYGMSISVFHSESRKYLSNLNVFRMKS